MRRLLLLRDLPVQVQPKVETEPMSAPSGTDGDKKDPRRAKASLPELGSEGLRHIPNLILYSFMGSPEHQCPECRNKLALTSKTVHRWFYFTFDEPQLSAAAKEEAR